LNDSFPLARLGGGNNDHMRSLWTVALACGLVCGLAVAPAGPASADARAEGVRCTLSGSLAFNPAITESPRTTTVTLKAQAVMCSDPEVSTADITGTLKGRTGKRTSQLSGTLSYAWHLRSGDTEAGVQEVSGVGIGAGFSFEGTTTSGRDRGRAVRIIPLDPGSFPTGKVTGVAVLARLTIK
jgi:hypothetical protein